MNFFRPFICAFMLVSSISMNAQQSEELQPELRSRVLSVVFSTETAGNPDVWNAGDADQPSSYSVLSEGGKKVYDINVAKGYKSQYGVVAGWTKTQGAKKGDKMLACITMRTLSARQESGESAVYIYFQQPANGYKKNFITQIGAMENWKTFYIPFIMDADLKAGDGELELGLGSLCQHIQVKNVEVLNFGQDIQLSELPETKFSYIGREEGAAWRKAALKRIEDIRTAPMEIIVKDAKGKPVKGAQVKVDMVQSAFIWGTAVNERMLAGEDELSDIYKNHLLKYFNTAVIENGFKAGGWAWDTPRKMQTLKAYNWLLQSGLRLKGHNLVWPAWKFNSPLTKYLAENNPDAFDRYIKAQFHERMALTKGKYISWDVVNEYMHEKEFFKVLPTSVMVDWYKLAHELDPDAELYLNDYAMLNGVQSPLNIQEFVDTIQSLRAKGAPIQGIGIQGHIGRQPRNPEQVITDLDLTTPTGLPVQITEFDINTNDEALQADYTRDFLIAVYSHPQVTGVLLWGFWQKAHWKPDAAMFTSDWTEKANGKMWDEWVLGKWTTKSAGKTDKKGAYNVRGHFGKYKVIIDYKGETIECEYTLSKDAQPLEIKMNK